MEKQLAEALPEKLKNQKLIESELTDAVITKLSAWTRFYVGIPLAILIAALALFGYTKLSDLNKLVEAAVKEIQPKLERVRLQAAEAVKSTNASLDEANRQKILVDNAQKDVEQTVRLAQQHAADINQMVAKATEGLQSQIHGLGNEVDTLKKAVDIPVNSQGKIRLTLFDGSRQPLAGDISYYVSLTDGNNKPILRLARKGSSTTIVDIPVCGNQADNYTIIISADSALQTGYYPVKVSSSYEVTVDLMLLPRQASYNFVNATWDNLQKSYPQLWRPLARDTDSVSGRARYSELMENTPAALASYLNLATALQQAYLPQGAALDYFRQLDWKALGQDRLVAYVDPSLLGQLALASSKQAFVAAPAVGYFHPGATRAYKQVQFGEANLCRST